MTDEPDERDFADAVPKPGHDGGNPALSRSTAASNQPPGGITFVAVPSGCLLPHGPAATWTAFTAKLTTPAGGWISSHGQVFSLPLSGPWQSTLPRPWPLA